MDTHVYLGLIDADPSVIDKIQRKHNITLDEVREALQWPAAARAAADDHSEHGWRVIAVGETATGRTVIAALLPAPPWAGRAAETWTLKTARWLSDERSG